MLQFGEKQVLVMVKQVDFGVYLAETMSKTEEKVLLPAKQVPEDLELGDPIEVFLYKDSKDRPIATTQTPAMMLRQFARLKVVSITKIGAFLDWGLEKDLFLPFREQTMPVKEGDEILVALYLDKSSRLCATMKVYPYLDLDSDYVAGDEVTGIVYEISPNFGAFVAVDYKYSALVAKKELTKELVVGQEITTRVTAVKEDGKLDLSLRQKAYLQMDEDSEKILQLLQSNKGVLYIHDKSAPEDIRYVTGMSKNEFKRAIGRLYKEHKIHLKDDRITLAEEKKHVSKNAVKSAPRPDKKLPSKQAEKASGKKSSKSHGQVKTRYPHRIEYEE